MPRPGIPASTINNQQSTLTHQLLQRFFPLARAAIFFAGCFAAVLRPPPPIFPPVAVACFAGALLFVVVLVAMISVKQTLTARRGNHKAGATEITEDTEKGLSQ